MDIDIAFTYSFKHPKYLNSLAIGYFNLEKQLVRLDFNEGAAPNFIAGIGYNIPTSTIGIERLKSKNVIVTDISKIDLSFDKFWDYYGKKVGNKKRVEKLWKALCKEDRIMAIGGIRRIKRYYNDKNLQLPIPETYINQRRWEDEYDIN